MAQEFECQVALAHGEHQSRWIGRELVRGIEGGGAGRVALCCELGCDGAQDPGIGADLAGRENRLALDSQKFHIGYEAKPAATNASATAMSSRRSTSTDLPTGSASMR